MHEIINNMQESFKDQEEKMKKAVEDADRWQKSSKDNKQQLQEYKERNKHFAELLFKVEERARKA